MRVHEKRLEIVASVAECVKKKKSVGFVPTMGALHNGHLALIKRALKENDYVVVSIFVNPTQFNNQEDLTNYPRTLDEDVKLLATVSKDILVFAPTPKEIYGDSSYSNRYNFGGLENKMEGKFRPGHFDGVGTVLKIFFEIITPTRAYFGEKDFQQLLIVKKLVAIEKLPIQIIGCPIYREESGLALSSRNKRLTPVKYENAPFIYTTLKKVAQDFGTKSVTVISNWVTKQFENHPELELEYFEIAKESDLNTVIRKHKDTKYRAFIVVFAGEIRLIDNIALN